MQPGQDLNNSMLPKNRRAVFGELLKYYKSLLFNMGLLLFVFSIPLLMVNVWSNLVMAGINASSLADAEKYRQMFSTLNMKNILYLPAALIFGVGLSGVIEILHRQIWAEDIIIKADFKKGIKSNYLVVALTLVVICLLNFLLQYLLYSNLRFDTSYKVVLGIVIGVTVLVAPLVILMWSSSIIYQLPLWGHIKNSMLLAMRKSLIMIPMGLLNLALIIITILPISYAIYICFLLLPLVIGPLVIVFNQLVCDHLFDEFINQEHFPEIYRKGMQKDE